WLICQWQARRAAAQDNVDGDEICVAEKIVLGDVISACGFGLFFGQVLAPGNGLHAEGLADCCRALAELAETKDAEREAFEVTSDRRLPRRAGFQPSIFKADPAGEFQHQAEGDPSGWAADRAGPADRDAMFRASFHVE